MQIEMTDRGNQSAHQDESAVTAVRRGDAERYRELVERHERRVYAVAWSRLGDATLAEEATQEAFIRAYRRLWLLGDGSKFSGWINTIARRVAINFGLRHRRELNKRERWALEHSDNSEEENSATESDPLHTPEALRQTLAELSAAHRECLVLFYLEGKSGAEAAAALGISEAALRVRLHRARTAMRERLEEKLEGSLAKLRPTKTLVPAIMAGVLASSSVKAATVGGIVTVGAGAKILSALTKSVMLSWLVPLVSLIGHLPSMAFAWFVSRKEQKNFRDADGFRARLYRQFFRSFLWGFPVLVIVIFALQHSAQGAWGIKGMWFGTATFGIVLMIISARALFVSCNVFLISQFAYVTIITIGIWALAWGWLPPALGSLPMVLATLLFACTLQYRPARMDYSLFLRATQGLLNLPDEAKGEAKVKPFDERETLRFARFIGARYLLVNFRRQSRGLLLLLPPVKTRFLVNMAMAFVPFGRGCSSVLLAWDGKVLARCSETDAADLSAINPSQPVNSGEMETFVADVIGGAWQTFRAGNPAAAARALGDVPEKDVFVVAPRRSPWTRWVRWWLVGSVALMVVAMVMNWRHNTTKMVSGRFYKPVSVSEGEVRAAFAQLALSTNKQSPFTRDASYALVRFEVLPSTNLFTPEAWLALKTLFLNEALRFGLTDSATTADRFDRLLGAPAMKGAVANGWLSTQELGFAQADVRRVIATASPQQRGLWFGLTEIQVGDYDGTATGYSALNTHDLARTVQCMQRLGCLEMIDSSPIAETLVRHQVLSKKLPVGRRQNLDPTLLHGTFLTFGSDPIKETWQSLVILEAFNALSRVDRDACVNGILRFHHGNGLFGSVREGDGFVIFGDAQDTFCAFESLRILKALDRVQDLGQWKFRPHWTSKPATPSAPRMVTWEEIVAWVCQQRLERFLRERKENPQAPARSLLAPE